jgi:hypothetical protein
MGVRVGADEDAANRCIADDVVEIVGKGTVGKKGGELLFPISALCTDIFQPDVVLPEDGIESGHAVDAEAYEGIVFVRVK